MNYLPHTWKLVTLNDKAHFSFENGIWTGKKPPFVECLIIRNTNFKSDGFLDFSDVAIISIEERQLAKKRLIKGDIIIERSGGGPKQPVGRVALFDKSYDNFCFSNFTSRLRVTNSEEVDYNYVHLFLLHFYLSG